MGKRSSVDVLPQEVKDWLMRLREQGATYDQIVAKLREMDSLAVPIPSRSALHRHMQEAERTKEMVDRQRVVAEAMVKELGEVDDSRVTRGNIAMLHAILTRVQQTALDAMMTGDGNIDMSAGEVMQLAKALDHLGKAAKDDVARTAAIRKLAKEEVLKTAEAAVGAAEAGGHAMSGEELLRKIREDIYGIYEK
ncbi:Mu-like prophage FluMu protein GP27 [Xanthobacter versatilis]|uniref:Mu-like prophage FluMu protein GP27 n=1 Tax=Xanthobacter autotrophicus (strain ATCC BAA-1158 / Py2) TaxID=78245 RepID=A7INX9_XANP2|nr:Mu-like prophage FluMu protein GP27 [Xanthobacter autotrophicus Py2]